MQALNLTLQWSMPMISPPNHCGIVGANHYRLVKTRMNINKYNVICITNRFTSRLFCTNTPLRTTGACTLVLF